ncbi:MAG: glycosyltransferase family 2 protein [Acidobacteria bacterium]|nr:MAG: glycosyltransferase family 2 protein [Acidobacteriota bacterium]
MIFALITLAFWLSAGVIVYAYVGYFVWLWVRAKWRPRPAMRGQIEPVLSVVMVVRNEESVLAAKLRNLLELDYPPERLQVVVVSDGSTDGTEAILREHASDPRVVVVLNQLAGGKAMGLNDGIQVAQGEIVVLTDARQKIEPGAIRLLMENFADPEVGAVSGELMLGDPASGETGRGMGLYWQIEKQVRELEAYSGSVVGATGAIYAVRRELIVKVPADTILDDVFIPMNVARQKFRVLFDARARAWDTPDLGAEREFRRKVRTLTGNYQLLQQAPWLLSRENPLRFEFISHKLIRLVVPFALIAALVTAAFLPGPFFRIALWGQLAFYGLSLLGWAGWNSGPVTRLAEVAYTFVALNAAALVAFGNFVTGHTTVWMAPPIRKEIPLR